MMERMAPSAWDAPTGSIDSTCGLLRYLQWSSWDLEKPTILFIGLHPFTDGDLAAVAIEHYESFCVKAGAGSLCLMNLFPFKCRSREALKEWGFPYQADECNETAIRNSVAALRGSPHTVLRTWGDVTGRELAVTKQILRVEEILRELGR